MREPSTMDTTLDDVEAVAKRMRSIYEKWENLRKAQQAYIKELESERDALRAQLDGMTAETRRPGLASGRTVLQRRLVGPWVEVQ